MEATTKKMSPKTLWTIAIVAIVIAMVWYNREKIKKMLGMGETPPPTPTPDPNKPTTNPSSNTATPSATALDYDKVIKLTNPTMKGKEEKLLQQMLNLEMTTRKNVPVTPQYPINTAANDVPLVTDGIVGDKTINLLYKYAGVRETSLNGLKTGGKMLSLKSGAELYQTAFNSALGI